MLVAAARAHALDLGCAVQLGTKLSPLEALPRQPSGTGIALAAPGALD